MSSVGTVRFWRENDGWGVIDSPDTPGGCWVHFTHLWSGLRPELGEHTSLEVSGGARNLHESETVDFDWESPGQDGYSFRAVDVRPRREPPHVTVNQSD